jgi:hypothetical protein
MQGRTPDADYIGKQVADDMVLAVGFGTDNRDPNTFLVAQKQVSEHSGEITSSTQNATYIRNGESTVRTGASRTLTVTGDRYVGDEFQEACLDMGVVYGVGNDVVKPYVYFSLHTGKGERGNVSIDVTADHSGAAGENDGFSATLTGESVPTAYAYAPPPAP